MHPIPHLALRAAALALAGAGATLSAHATVVDVTVTVHNLVPANGIAFAPLHVGFHSGSFDAFDLGSVAAESIVSVAEGGAGGARQAAFAAATKRPPPRQNRVGPTRKLRTPALLRARRRA